MLNIFSYSEPHLFLHDAWREKKAKNPSFSMRAWAKRLGFKNNAALSLMLAGKRPIPKKYIPHLATELGLKAKEIQYLDALIDLKSARDPKEREYCLSRLKQVSPESSISYLELEHFKFLGDPLNVCILEMIDLKEFQPDPKWIQKKLLFHADLNRIEEVLDRLMVLELVVEKDGKLVKQHRHLSTRKDVQDKGKLEFHRNVSLLASEAILNQDPSVREFNSYAMNINRRNLPKAKELLRKFTNEFIKEIEEDPGNGESTYQLNLQFFGVSELNK